MTVDEAATVDDAALITGAGSGIGQAIAVELAARGYRVHLVGRRRARLEETAERVRQGGGHATVHLCDVSRPEDVAALARAFPEPPELLVLNAGVTSTGPLLEHSLDDWAWVFGTVLGGVVFGVQHFVPPMVQAGRGKLLLVGSQAGLVPDAFVQHGPYTSAKSAVISLGFSLAEELRETGVQVSVLIPAGVDTGFSASSREGRTTPGHEPTGSAAQIMPRPGLPLSLPGHPVFLSADEVARIAVDGVERGDPIIATHPGAKPMVEEYFGRILAAYDRDGS